MSARRSYEYRSYEEDISGEDLPSFEVIPQGTQAREGPEGAMYHHRSYSEEEEAIAEDAREGVVHNRTSVPPRNIARQETQPVDRKEECDKYRQMILNDVGRDDGNKEPMIIIVIGTPGVGKSSLICSIAAALSQERWRQYAYVGSYGEDGDPMTVFTETFDKCAMDHGNGIDQNAEKFKDYLLPTLVDVAGVENENTDLWKELLRIVFYGILPEGDSLFSAYKYGVKHGVQGLRKNYGKFEEILKVDRIIFLASATESVPVNLIHSVREAARPSGDDGNIRAVPLYGVMTKVDKVVPEGKEPQEDEVSQELFKERETLFINKLGLRGASNRYVSLSNYCDDTDPGNRRLETNIPELDLPVLRFLAQVVDPAVRVINKEHKLMGSADDATDSTDATKGVRRRRRPEPKEQQENKTNELRERQPVGTTFTILAIVLFCFVVFLILNFLVSFSKQVK